MDLSIFLLTIITCLVLVMLFWLFESVCYFECLILNVWIFKLFWMSSFWTVLTALIFVVSHTYFTNLSEECSHFTGSNGWQLSFWIKLLLPWWAFTICVENYSKSCFQIWILNCDLPRIEQTACKSYISTSVPVLTVPYQYALGHNSSVFDMASGAQVIAYRILCFYVKLIKVLGLD